MIQNGINGNNSDVLSLGTLLDFFSGFNKAVEANKNQMNNINVFPVPDADTGTNIYLTLSSTASVIENFSNKHSQNRSISEFLQNIYRETLMNARGNSGLIMAQFLGGFAKAFQEGVPNCETFATGMSVGAQMAKGAVSNPQEGTILTVMAKSAQACRDYLSMDTIADRTLQDMLSHSIERAKEALEETKEQHQTLKNYGVVDSGGLGFTIAMIGGLTVLENKDPSLVRISVNELDNVQKDTPNTQEWGYCISFGISDLYVDTDTIKHKMESVGSSVVVSGDLSNARIHVHCENAGKIVNIGLSYGNNISNIEISNMNAQVEKRFTKQIEAPAQDIESKKSTTAIVAVATGQGMKDIFTSVGLGVAVTVDGTHTNNIGVDELLKAIDVAPSDSIVLLPNSTQMFDICKLSARHAKKEVAVLETSSMQEGIAAVLTFSPDENIENNIKAMETVFNHLICFEVSRATEDITLREYNIKKGLFYVLYNKQVIVAGRDAPKVAFEAIRKIVQDHELVTVYYGDSIDSEEANTLVNWIKSSIVDIETELIYGGQPDYPFLVSIE